MKIAKPPFKFRPKHALGSQTHGPAGGASRYEAATFWVTLVGVILVVISTAISAINAVLMRAQIEVMDSQQRPWIEVDLKLSDAIEVDESGSIFRVAGSVKNVGQAIATGITVEYNTVIFRSNQEQFVPRPFNEISKNQKETCEHADIYSAHDHSLGYSLFPGNSNDDDVLLTLSPSDIKGEGDKFKISIIGCASYRSYRSNVVHHTPFSFDIDRDLIVKSVDGADFHLPGYSLNMLEKNPADLLRIRRSAFGNANAD